MNEYSEECKTWKDVIINFFETRVENIRNGQKCSLYQARKKLDGSIDAHRQYLALSGEDKKWIDKLVIVKKRLLKIKEKIKNENDSRELLTLKKDKIYFEKEKKIIVSKSKVMNAEDLASAKILADNLDESREKSPANEIRQWLEITASRNIEAGKRIIKSTHVMRFTHSSAESSGVLLREKSNDDILLTTASIKKELDYDFAHNNGNLITVSRFLALKHDGKQIIDCILGNNFEFLSSFVNDQSQFEALKERFSGLVEVRELKSADKAKQIYFPLYSEVKIGADRGLDSKNYHLIIPLFSSSLAEEIYTLQKSARQEKSGSANNSGSKSHYHSKPHIEFPNLASQKFGGAQPQNVSMLNKDRGGRTYLLSSQPPLWESLIKPPIRKKSLFENFFSSNIKNEISFLRWYLLLHERIDLSIHSPQRMKNIESSINNIINNALLPYISSIQKEIRAGWSQEKNIKLKIEHQYLLDPFRQDDEFQTSRKVSNWQTVVCDDFGHWLNYLLREKDKKFTPQPEHRRLWAKLLEAPLREHNEMVESAR